MDKNASSNTIKEGVHNGLWRPDCKGQSPICTYQIIKIQNPEKVKNYKAQDKFGTEIYEFNLPTPKK